MQKLVECSTYGFLDTDHRFVSSGQGNSCVCVIHLFSFARNRALCFALLAGTLFFINISERIQNEARGIGHLVDVRRLGHQVRIELVHGVVAPCLH